MNTEREELTQEWLGFESELRRTIGEKKGYRHRSGRRQKYDRSGVGSQKNRCRRCGRHPEKGRLPHCGG